MGISFATLPEILAQLVLAAFLQVEKQEMITLLKLEVGDAMYYRLQLVHVKICWLQIRMCAISK